MAELQTQGLQVGKSGKGWFDFYNSSLIAITPEEELKFYSFSEKDGSQELQEQKSAAIEDKVTWFASNGKDTIAYVKQNNKVYTWFREKAKVLIKSLMSSSKACKIMYPYHKLIMILTDTLDIFLYWLAEEKFTTYKAFHEGKIAWADIDWTTNFIATIGTDWMLNIWKIGKNSEDDELFHSSKIFSSWDSSSYKFLQTSWSPDGNLLAIPGDFNLKLFKKSNRFEVVTKDKISHDSKISITYWITSNILVTIDLKSCVKIWNWSTQTLVNVLNLKGEISQVKYSPSLKWLAFYDSNGYLETCIKDFEGEKDLQIVESSSNSLSAESESKQNEEKNISKEIDMDDQNEEEVSNGDYEMKSEKEEPNIDLLIGARPQPALMPSSCLDPIDQTYKMLWWNSVGSVAVCDQDNYKWIKVEFADKSFYKNLILDNDIDAELADLSLDGILMASKAEEVDLDEYEDETNKKKYISQIKFYPFETWNSIKQWKYNLPRGESAEVLAIGVKWWAVATDSNYIRVFSIEGVQTFIMSHNWPIVSLLGYENLLCIISHNGLPMLECQNLKMKIVDTERNFHKVLETEVPLTPSSRLMWAGYSEEGELFVYDSDGILKMFSASMGNNWIPVLDVKAKYDINPNQFWIVEISSNSVVWCILKDKLYPDAVDKKNIYLYKFSIPFLGLNSSNNDKENSAASKEEKFFRENLDLTHQQWRKRQWSHLKNTRTQADPNHHISSSIWSNEEILEKQKELDITTVHSIRIAALAKDKAKILMLAKRLHLTKYFDLSIELLQELQFNEAAEGLIKLLENKKKADSVKNDEVEKSVNQEESKPVMSLSEKIAKNRASLEKELTSKIVAKKSDLPEQTSKEEPLNNVVATNPFAKKENNNSLNKKKNIFDDLMVKVGEKKKPVTSQNPFAKGSDKQKLK